jgi:hypothetical protein
VADAEGAFGGSVLLYGDHAVSVVKRRRDGFGPAAPLLVTRRDERVRDAALAGDGDAVVLTVRRRRVRATISTRAGVRRGPVAISGRQRNVLVPVLAVASDGTAVAAWQSRNARGWRVQAAVRRRGARRFGAPQSVSPTLVGRGDDVEPSIFAAAGGGGRAAIVWQSGARPLQLAYVDIANLPSGGVAVGGLHVAQGRVGAPLPAPEEISRGGQGLTSGTQLAVTFTAGGSAIVAWARPGEGPEQGGTLEVFSRGARAGFGAPQTLATGASDIALAGGPAASAAIAWKTTGLSGSVHAAVRPRTGGTFGPDTRLSGSAPGALSPSVAVAGTGEAIAAWDTLRRDGRYELMAALHRGG